MAERGDLKNRDDVIKTLEGAGFEIARTTKKSISIKDPEEAKYPPKGAIYEQDFRFGKSFEQTSSKQAKDTEQVVATEFKKHEQRLIDLLSENESNEQRYPRAEQTPIADYVKNLEHRSHSHRDSTFTDVGHP